MEDLSKMLENLLSTDEGKAGFAQAMAYLGQAGGNDFGTASSTSSEDSTQGNADDLPFDPQMLLTMQSLLTKLPKHDQNTDFLHALKPLLKPEHQAKTDEAIRMMKLFSLLPALQESGILKKLF